MVPEVLYGMVMKIKELTRVTVPGILSMPNECCLLPLLLCAAHAPGRDAHRDQPLRLVVAALTHPPRASASSSVKLNTRTDVLGLLRG